MSDTQRRLRSFRGELYMWHETNYHCVACGAKSVWREADGINPPVGDTHICLACHATFHVPYGVRMAIPYHVKSDLIRSLAIVSSLANETATPGGSDVP